MQAFIPKYDVIVITETKIDTQTTSPSLSVDGYLLSRQDRTNHGGGVATYIKNDLVSISLTAQQEIAIREGLEVTINKIKRPGGRDLIVVGVYRPPASKAEWFDKFEELLLQLMPLGQLIILGDLNADLLKPRIQPGKALREALALAGTKVHSTVPTRITAETSTCIDIIALDKDLVWEDYSVGDVAASDHLPVTVAIKFNPRGPLEPVVKRSFRRVDFTDLGRRIENIKLTQEAPQEVNGQLESWLSQVMGIFDEVAPLKKFPWRRNKLPWLTDDIQDLMERRDAVLTDLKQAGQTQQTKKDLADDLKLLRRQVKSRIRRAIKEEGAAALAQQNHKEAWRYIKAATFTSAKCNEQYLDASTLNDFFASIVHSQTDPPIVSISSCDGADSFAFSNVSLESVEGALNSTKANTAMGHDGIPGLVIKKLAASMATNICHIFNLSLNTNTFPNIWKKANVTAVWKGKGCKYEPTNYRPISVLPILARTLEKLAAYQLNSYCSARSIIPIEQFGFRAKSSCEHALLKAMDGWCEAVDGGAWVGALLIDLSRAFDTVPHQMLLHELAAAGCGVGACEWFGSYLTGREQRVVQGQIGAPWMKVTKGVPQGSCLSPLLFNLYVRNLPACCTADTVQFADDITNSAADKELDVVAQKLTVSFEQVRDFCKDHELTINTGKTQLLIMKSASRKLPTDFQLNLDGTIIKPLNAVKILGVTIDQHLTLGEHIDKVVKKGNGLLGALGRASPYLTRQLLRMAYISLVRTHLEYCSGLLQPAANTHLKRLDVVQKKAARIICDVPRTAHAAPLLELLNLQPLDTRRRAHISGLVEAILDKRCHPAFLDFFTVDSKGVVVTNFTPRLRIGTKRFAVMGPTIYNEAHFSPGVIVE